jgi:flagellar hook protein FlgE
MTLYDSLGNSHNAELYFQKSADNTWNWMMTMSGTDLSGAGITSDDFFVVAEGEMTFTEAGLLDTLTTTERIDYSTGALTTLAQPEQGAVILFDFAGGGQPGQSIDFNFGAPAQVFDSGSGTFVPNPTQAGSGTTQFALPSATLFQTQNGFGSGVLESFSIDEQGVVKGLFSNGQTLDLMQLALAKFASPDGLNPVGQNLFSQSAQSGEAVVAAPRTGGLGAIVSNALEISNVDLASQFVELIRAQQAFQANARIITTGDDLLTEVVNLRR